LRFSGYTKDEMDTMSEREVYRRYFAAAKLWQETLGALVGGAQGAKVQQFEPSMPSSSAQRGGRSSPSSTRHQFPTGFD
jgi:hypothetical protein